VDDVILVDGPDTISLKNEVKNLVAMLSSTKVSVEGETAIVDAAVAETLNAVRNINLILNRLQHGVPLHQIT
jgi:hypothetical protein